MVVYYHMRICLSLSQFDLIDHSLRTYICIIKNFAFLFMMTSKRFDYRYDFLIRQFWLSNCPFWLGIFHQNVFTHIKVMRITRYFSQNMKECMEGIHTGSWCYLDWHQRTNQQTNNIPTILGCNLICAAIFNFQSDPKLNFVM